MYIRQLPGFVVDDRVEQLCSFETEQPCSLLNAAQHRTTQLAEELVIINPDHRHILGHPQTMGTAGLKHLAASIVICGHKAKRLGQRGQPGTKTPLYESPSLAGGMVTTI